MIHPRGSVALKKEPGDELEKSKKFETLKSDMENVAYAQDFSGEGHVHERL